ncbi:hypothetical protein BJ322DRAFT_162417 [Thelephora terrestris]|uniref:JmjC domain-containing protein n=1 Tax=Thelephora terrestris TaxID=56493 RepID=A0A9P6L4N6_9AGAM|nr:hypothetical protein BJ322DRAFT_162417 [Thelephora terrestris]
MPVLMPYPPVPPKRANGEEEESSNAPRKKPRTSRGKADGFVAPKRGYTAKKRNEAQQIAAQNEMMASVSYKPQQSEGEQSTDRTMTPPTGGGNVRPPPIQVENGGKLQPELQFARCMSHRYRNERFPRCVSCTRRWAGDTCRFQSIRFFLRDENKVIVGISFVENQKADSPTMDFPKKWNVPLDASHLNRVKRTVARALLPVLKSELKHLHVPEIIRRPRESDVRATCDTCMTSIFSSSWMCRLCGREACAECYEQVKILTDNSGAEDADVFELQARREKHSRRNPFFLACTRRNEHQAKDFSPMSRFCKSELELVIKEMEELLASPDQDPPVPSDVEIPDLDVEAAPDNQIDSLPSHRIVQFKHEDLPYDLFPKLWAKGKPLVVTGLLPQFKISWTPEHFIEHYGSKNCLVIQCQSDMNKRITVGEFFKEFGKYEGRTDCWKLKDWPPSTDFKTAFPELYADFSQAIPMPNYVRRDGVLNIASHFPANTVAPDIGPKMYNAMASADTPGTKGTTRLHMDMADAANVMLYAAPTPDGKPGTALWDIFDASDAGKIRDFLKSKFKGKFQNDPIHSQMFYLDCDLRKELYEEFGVKSYRIYQKPGDVVFVPAGCAHQVCNLADCMKIAIDFVSPENIDRCELLTKEFREQNQSMQWKEDVLQLRTMMWFSWLSCRIHEAIQGKEKTNTSSAVAITSVSNKKLSEQANQPRTSSNSTAMDVDGSITMLPLD